MLKVTQSLSLERCHVKALDEMREDHSSLLESDPLQHLRVQASLQPLFTDDS
jgi:hypothetical protein